MGIEYRPRMPSRSIFRPGLIDMVAGCPAKISLTASGWLKTTTGDGPMARPVKQSP
jgi:hypothetical protein